LPDYPQPCLEDLHEAVRRYYPDADLDRLTRAYEFAEQVHTDDLRKTGEPYIIHPLWVALILANVNSDLACLEAALLHDTHEDHSDKAPLAVIDAKFGPIVTRLVEGVSKLRDLHMRSREETQAQNFRKLLIAMGDDIRVILIKLADRLHNMRTLGPFGEAKKREKADETLRIYAPLAHRLGMQEIRAELEDLSLQVLDPEAYEEISEKVARTRDEREQFVRDAATLLEERLKSRGIQAEVHGRPKHFYSIFKKMQRQELDFEQIFDLFALRIMVWTEPECYAALGVVHELWVPLPEMFADHIAKPKPNGYRSLHTKVIGPAGTPLEVQIRNWEMHRANEYGIAAHWRYKEDGGPFTDFDRKLAWLRQLLDLSAEFLDTEHFMRGLQQDLFQEQVYIFTPKGELIEMPRGSTPVDFAYRIHTLLGHECTGARVNGRPIPLQYELHNGDICEVDRRKGSQPSRDWLGFVQTSQARAKIHGFFRKQSFTENVRAGRSLLEREARRLGAEGNGLLDESRLEQVAKSLNLQSVDMMLSHIGSNDLAIETVMRRLQESETEEWLRALGDLHLLRRRRRTRKGATFDIAVGGMEGLVFALAKCCDPLPGDPIVGYITRGGGLTVHRADCANLRYLATRDGVRVAGCQWIVPEGAQHSARLEIVAGDRVGMLYDITAVITEVAVNIGDISIVSREAGRAMIHLLLEVDDAQQLATLITRLEALADVISVRRVAVR
jgi:GTP diphosphokinase / guanosine-3',5'-bis(diphosphate) 3'-diphosphatase